jgi:hypothetical protein
MLQAFLLEKRFFIAAKRLQPDFPEAFDEPASLQSGCTH